METLLLVDNEEENDDNDDESWVGVSLADARVSKLNCQLR